MNLPPRFRCVRRLLLLLTLSCVLFGAFSTAAALTRQSSRSEEQLPIDNAIRKGTLNNGITYLIRTNRRPENRAELRLVVNAGSILEDDNQLGLAHFVEHMAFNGSRHFQSQELVQYLESIGMQFGPDINAYTIFDETVYMLQLPTDTAGVMETGIQVLRDWADGISFDPVEIDKERGVVIEEWRARLGAATRIQDQQLPVQVAGSRYASRLPIGTLKSLESFEHESLVQFYRDWYRPELISVIAVGDFDVDWIEDLIRNEFGDMQSPAQPRKREYFPVPENIEPRFTIVSDPEATRALVSVMHRRLPEQSGSRAEYRGGLVRSMYSAMLNQRLFELTQTADPPFIAGSSSDGGLGFARTVSSYDLLALVQDGNYLRALEHLLEEAERVRRFGFTQTELNRAKVNLLRGMEIAYNERDNTESALYADEYVRHVLQNETVPGITFEYELTRSVLPVISLDEVNALADHFMTTENRVISISGPENEDQPLPSEAEVAAVFERINIAGLTPYEDSIDDGPLLPVIPDAGTIVDESSYPDTGITRWTLSNGIRIVLKPTDFKNDEILLRGSSAGGTSLAADESFISSLLAVQVVSLSGVGGFNPITLRKKLTGKAVSVSPFISSLSQGFSGSASPDDLETLFQLLYLYATAPRADSELFQSYMTRMNSLLIAQEASPNRAYSDTLSSVLSRYHFRARPITAGVLAEADMNEGLQFYRKRFSDFSDYTFYIVGTFSTDEIMPLIKTYLGSLPASGQTPTWRDQGIRLPDGVENRTVYAGIEPKSRVTIVFNGETPWTIEKRRRLGMLQKVLDTRLREVLREDLGGTYGVSISASLSDEPYESYSVSISFGCSPERVDELVAQVFTEIESLQTAAVDESYVHNARESSIRAYQTGLRENGYWLSSLRFYDKHGIPAEQILNNPSRYLDTITADDLVIDARVFLNTERYVKVVLLPADSVR